jgi:Domain of unknown function (DUF4234)
MTEPVPSSTTPTATGPIGKPRGIGMTVLLFFITLGIYGFFWNYYVFKELKDYSGNGIGGGVAVLLWFIFSPINFFLLPSEIKNVYEAEGRQSPVKPIIGLWFLLPIIGWIIWLVKVQGAQNELWVSKGAPAV